MEKKDKRLMTNSGTKDEPIPEEMVKAFRDVFAFLDHPFQVMESFQSEFEGESDRAAVILSTSMIEDLLASVLRTRLVPGIDEDMFKGYGPLSNLSSRIEMTYGIGAISVKLRRDLHLIRKIRNEFAHNVEGCSFESQNIRNRIIELQRSLPMVEKTSGPDGKIPTSRDKFQTAITFILMNLSMVQQMSKHFSICAEETIYGKTLIKSELATLFKSSKKPKKKK